MSPVEIAALLSPFALYLLGVWHGYRGANEDRSRHE